MSLPNKKLISALFQNQIKKQSTKINQSLTNFEYIIFMEIYNSLIHFFQS